MPQRASIFMKEYSAQDDSMPAPYLLGGAHMTERLPSRVHYIRDSLFMPEEDESPNIIIS